MKFEGNSATVSIRLSNNKARFSDAGLPYAWMLSCLPASENLHINGLMHRKRHNIIGRIARGLE